MFVPAKGKGLPFFSHHYRMTSASPCTYYFVPAIIPQSNFKTYDSQKEKLKSGHGSELRELCQSAVI